MNGLYWMVLIVDRRNAGRFLDCLEKNRVSLSLQTAAQGTAASELLDYFGLEKREKAVLLAVVTGPVWQQVRRALQHQMMIDVPGTGIAFIIPLSSIGGKRQLAFLTAGQDYTTGEESALKNTKYELVVAVANQGYTELVMEAARKGGAGGGTVIHAKGTGMEQAQHFLGVSLVSEKEMILIVVRTAAKNQVMRAIMDDAGLETKAGALVFSLPVTQTAGLRLTDHPDSQPAADAE